MGFNCGIVGLPNVGKSTLFNALTKAGIARKIFHFAPLSPIQVLCRFRIHAKTKSPRSLTPSV